MFSSSYVLPANGRILLTIAGIIALIGGWLLITGIIPYAGRAYKKTLRSYAANKKGIVSSGNAIDAFALNMAKKLSPYMHLTSVDRAETEEGLALCGETMTPEEYKAYSIVIAGFFLAIGAVMLGAGSLFSLVFFTIMGIIAAVFGIFMYFKIKNNLKVSTKKTVSGIESELPRFVSYCILALNSEDKGVLAMLERYTASDKFFGEELDRAIADAKTSNFAAAMIRWDRRVNSNRLKKVLHGLISANNGDDVKMYFEMLDHEFTEHEINLLKESAKKLPKKMTIPKILMYTSIFATFFIPLVLDIVDDVAAIFGSGLV